MQSSEKTSTNSSRQNNFSDTIDSFESILSSISRALEVSKKRIDQINDLRNQSAEEIENLKSSLMPALDSTREVWGRTRNSLRSNPRPAILVLAGLLGAVLVFSYFDRDSKELTQHSLH